MNNQKDFIVTYEEISEESFLKWGNYYPPRNWEEFNILNKEDFKKYIFKKVNGIEKTKSFIHLAEKLNEFAFYDLYQKIDFESLNDILYQISRQRLLNKAMLESGTDHCNVFFEILKSFSCNDFSTIENFFPKNLPLSKGKFYTEVSVNLLKVLYYKQKQFEIEAIEIANKFLQKKITMWEKYVVLYFIALIEQNANDASFCLQELCSAYQKMEHSVNKLYNKLAKYFAYEVHGLYRFAMIVNKDLFNQIKQPTHQSFFNEFELWHNERNYPIGKIYYKYPNDMDYLNKIYEAEIPTVELYKPYPNKNELYKNTNKFIEDLTENTMKIMNNENLNKITKSDSEKSWWKKIFS